jgi:hypothetical protein
MTSRYNKIFLGPVEIVHPQVREFVASQDVLPGCFVVLSGGQWALAGASTVGKVWIVQDDYFQLKSVEEAILAGSSAVGMELLVESIYAARVPTGVNIHEGNALTPGANGKVAIAGVSDLIVAYAEESYNNNTGVDQLIKVRPAGLSYLSAAPIPQSWQTVSQWAAYDPLIASGASFATANTRIVLDKSLFPVTTTKLRFTFDGPVSATDDSAAGFTAAVGLAAGSGNAWDYAVAPTNLFTSPVALTFSESGDPVNHQLSNEINIVVNGTKDVVVSMLYDSGDTGTSENTGVEPPTTWHMYLNAGGGALGDLTPAGLLDVRSTFGNNHQYALSKIEAYA